MTIYKSLQVYLPKEIAELFVIKKGIINSLGNVRKLKKGKNERHNRRLLPNVETY